MTRRAGRGFVGATVGATLLALALSGCSLLPGTACTAIGWYDTVQVTVPGSGDPGSPVAAVAVCQERGCEPSLVPTAAPAVAPGSSAGAATPAASPSAEGPGEQDMSAGPSELPVIGATDEHSGDTWTVVTRVAADHGRVGVFDAADRPLRARTVELDWVRHGGSERCGGPSTAEVVVQLP